MKKDKLVDISLSKLLKRFANTDVIANMEKEYRQIKPLFISPKLIDDNGYLKKVKLNEQLICDSLISIKEKGLNTPLIIRPKKDHYEIVLGRKRLIAAKKFKLESVPCAIINVDDEEMLVMLAADIRDSNYSNMVELSIVCNRLTKDYKYTQKDIAKLLHQSRSQITNIIRLFNLPETVLADVSLGKLSFGHAKCLLTLPDEVINDTVAEIYKHNLSVRSTEKMIYDFKNHTNYKKTEQYLRDFVNADVNISKNGIKFSFKTEQDKNQFIKQIIDKTKKY